MAPLVDDSSISEQHLAAIGEVWKVFIALFAAVPENQRQYSIYGIVMIYLIFLYMNRHPHPRCSPPHHHTSPPPNRNITRGYPHPKRLSAALIRNELARIV